MSRIGKKPIIVPSGVTAIVEGQTVKVKGPKGELSVDVLDLVSIELKEGEIIVEPTNQTQQALSVWGMSRTLVQNLVTGVTEGFEKKLLITGVGYRAQMQGQDLKLALGLSHDVVFKAPEGIKLAAPQATEIIVSGIDKQAVGQTAANIREFRPPEPYKGKGIRYEDEYIFRKEGKKK